MAPDQERLTITCIMNLHLSLCAAFAAAVLAGQVAAQGLRTFRTLVHAGSRTSFVLTEKEPNIRFIVPETGAVHLIANNVWLPGCYAHFSHGSGLTDFIFGGTNVAGAGVVQVVRDSGSGGYTDLGTQVLTGSDICGVAYSTVNQKLYLLDAGQKRIMAGSFTPGGAIPTSWTVAATIATVPELNDAGGYELALTDAAEPRLELRQVGPVVPETVEFTVHSNGSVTHHGKKNGSREFSALEDSGVVPGATQLFVRGPANTQVFVVEVDGSATGTSIGSITTNAAGEGNVTISPAVDITKVYAARTAGHPEPTEPYVVPLMRWGPAGPLSMFGGLQLRRWGNIGTRCHVGNDQFYFSVRSEPQPGQTVTFPETYEALLLLGIHGVHTIENTPQGPMVMGAWFGSDTMNVLDATGAAAIVDAPIPNDPGLEGLVLMVQWAITKSGQDNYYLSDIVGVRIRNAAVLTPHQGSPATMSAQATGPGSGSSQQMERLQTWMQNGRFKRASANILKRIKNGAVPR